MLLGDPGLLLSDGWLRLQAAGVGVLKLGLCDLRSGLRSGLAGLVPAGVLRLLLPGLLLVLALGLELLLLLDLASGSSRVLLRDVCSVSLQGIEVTKTR